MLHGVQMIPLSVNPRLQTALHVSIAEMFDTRNQSDSTASTHTPTLSDECWLTQDVEQLKVALESASVAPIS